MVWIAMLVFMATAAISACVVTTFELIRPRVLGWVLLGTAATMQFAAAGWAIVALLHALEIR